MKKIRKQVYDLTPADLQAHPMWEFALDEEGVHGQDEATVRPLERNAYGPEDLGIVRTKFTLADGTVLTGFITPPDEDDPDGIVHPSMVTERGHVGLWFGLLKPSPLELKDLYKLLVRNAKQVFPIEYVTDCPLTGGPVSGRLEGFQRFGEGEPRRIVTFK